MYKVGDPAGQQRRTRVAPRLQGGDDREDEGGQFGGTRRVTCLGLPDGQRDNPWGPAWCTPHRTPATRP